jgi:phospho-N-acetylmuramoyl-pentapeptide-transferase
LSLHVDLAAFWYAFLAAAILAAPIFRILVKWKSQQTISQYAPEGHQTKQGTPTMGGLIIVKGAVIGLLILALTQGAVTGFVGSALALLVGFSVIGFVDDFVIPRMMPGKRGLGWKQKLLMQILVAALAGFLATGALGLETWVWVFFVLFFANAYNFADGLDALAAVLLLTFVIGLAGVVLISRSDPVILTVSAALAGAVLPFLYLNAPPAKVFMGDVGSLPIGAVLGAAVVHTFQTSGAHPVLLAWLPATATAAPMVLLGALAVLSFVMIAELLPPPMQVFWVKVFKKRLFPYTPIHHAFEKAGWKETRVVGLFGIAQLLLSVLAVTILQVGLR